MLPLSSRDDHNPAGSENDGSPSLSWSTREEQTAFVDRYHPVICLLLRRHRIPSREIEEIAQDIWLALVEDDFRRLRAWNPERASFDTFFSVVTRNLILDYLRSRRYKTERRHIALTEFLAPGEEDEENFIEALLHQHSDLPEQEQERRVEQAVRDVLDELVADGELRPRDRLALLLRLHGCSNKDIARHFQRDVNFAENLLKQARRKCRESLRERRIRSPRDLLP